MILTLRQHHRRVFSGLAVLLPLLFAVGIALRRSVPESEALPGGWISQANTFTATGVERGDLFDHAPVRVRLYRDHRSGALAVGLSATGDFLKPDLMVYWSAGEGATRDDLPAEARLLGAFVSTTLTLPPEASTTVGQLILFSLADQEIVDVSKATLFDAPHK